MKSGRWRGHVGYLWLSGRTITANFFPYPDTPLQPVLPYYLPPTPSTCLFVFSPLWPRGQTRPLQKILVKQNQSHRWDARGLVKVDPKGHPQVSLPLVHSVSSFSLRSLNPMIFPQVSDFQQPAPLSASFSAQFPHLSLSQPTMCSVFITLGNASLFACSSFSTSLLYWKDPEAVPSLPVLWPLLLSL